MAIVDKRGTDGFPAQLPISKQAHMPQTAMRYICPGSYTAPTGVVAQNFFLHWYG